MSAKELAEVLTGLTHAFSTIAYESYSDDRYQVRITDIDSGSARLLFEAIAFAKANPAAATAIAASAAVIVNAGSNIASGAYKVVTDLAKLIDAKKRLRSARVATVDTTFVEGGVRLLADADVIVLSKEQYELLLTRSVDRSLSKIVSPLAERRVDRFKIRRSEIELVTVDARQRGYFDFVEATESKGKDGSVIVGTFNSLSKTNLRGTFYTADGVHVPYKYVGGDVRELIRGFGSRENLRVRGHIRYGADSLPTFVEVEEIEFLQGDFFEPDTPLLT
jgi:hypothetical protein